MVIIRYVMLFVVFAVPSMASAQDRAPLFPARLGLEAKWETFKKQPLTAATLATILKEDPEGSQVVRWEDARYSSIWASAQRRVKMDAKLAAELRQSQEREAQTLVEQAAGDFDKLMPIARRFPWADSVHSALYEIGMRDLRQGKHSLAARSFQDVLLRSTDVTLRARAQVGLLLTSAHEPPGALDAAFRDIDPKAVFPLLGKEMSAEEIRERLAVKAGISPRDLKKLDKKSLEVPRSASWVYERPASHDGGLLVAGPSLLAWYDGGNVKPAWTQTNSNSISKEYLGAMLPGPFIPVVGANRVYARWGMQTLAKKVGPNTIILADVAAFDARTGSQLWSTSNNPDWRGLTPVNDPAMADGRLYLLAVAQNQEYAPIYLACLDAQDGRLLWKRELVQHHTTLPGVPRLDVARFGNPVTIAGGLVYCSTSMGIVACCDARDGLIEWIRTYPQDRPAAVSQKLGAAPVAVGSKMCFLPRDASLIFALDRESGELAWLKQDEASTALGVHDKCLIIAGARKLAAIDVETGKTRWDKALQESADHRAMLVGSAIYVGTPSKLLRLDAGTGAIAEARDAEKGDAVGGLVLRDQTLFGTTLSAESKPVAVIPPALADKTNRVVHRHATPLKLDGQPTEWDLFHPTALAGPAGAQGKLVITHDDQHLYVGFSATGGDLRGQRLELGINVDKKISRWTITPDGQGSATWEAIDGAVPAGAKAATHQHLVDKTLTFELAIPLASILATKNPKETGWGRLGFDIAVRADASAPPMLRQAHELFLHRLTADQENAALQLAAAFPDTDASWQILEQGWRARRTGPASTSDFLRDLIKRDPNAPIVGPALVRLDQLQRKTAASDPSGDILNLAEEVGVPAPVRTWYKQVAQGYISQWVYVDPTFDPQGIELELFDGATRVHRVLFGTMPPQVAGGGGKPLAGGLKVMTINGKTRMWIGGIEVDPKTRQPLGAAPKSGPDAIGKRIMPLPPTGVWHEFRIPLLWIAMHDKPIHGISFTQRGGSNIYWERTAIVIDGKEHLLPVSEDDDGHRIGTWKWVDKPVKLSKKTHTTPHPQFKNEEVRHAVTFKTGFSAHIIPAPGGTAGVEQILAQNLPLLACDVHANVFLSRAEALWTAAPDKLSKTRQEIVKRAAPEDVTRWLDVIVSHELRRGNAKTTTLVDELIKESKLSDQLAKEFQKTRESRFIRNWQAIGPFPIADAAPDVEVGVRLDAEYQTLAGKLKWKPHESASELVELKHLLGDEKTGVVYAACWIHSETKQSATLQVTTADRVQAWLNPKADAKLLVNEPFFRANHAGISSATMELQGGWNVLLVRCDTHVGRCAFAVELREAKTGRPLDGVKVQATRPQ